MHCVTIGDPRCVRHELFAMLRIWIVDGETVWQELYPRGSGRLACGRLGLTGCGHCRCLVEVWNCVHVDISSGTRMASARGSATREAIPRRGEPVQLQFVGKDFLPAIAPKSPLLGRATGVLQLRDRGFVPLICPTCQMFSQDSLKASMPATTMLLCMGLFSIF